MGTLITADMQMRHGLKLPKQPKGKFKNLLSVDGVKFFMYASPVKSPAKTSSSGRVTSGVFLDTHGRYGGNVSAVYAGVQRGLSNRPIDCSYMGRKTFFLHDTPEDEIATWVNKLASVGTGRALAVFALPTLLYDSVLIAKRRVKSVVFSGKKGDDHIQLTVDINLNVASRGGFGGFEAKLKGAVYDDFYWEISAQTISKYLWRTDCQARLNEHRLLEVSSPAMNGTLYLAGTLHQPKTNSK